MASSCYNDYMIANTSWRVPEKYDDLISIGSGGFGAVCSAFDKTINESVVIKKLTRPFECKFHAKRTYREIILLKHVSHQNVIQLLDIFYHTENQDLQEIYLVTMFMDTTLHDRLYKDSKVLTDDYKMIYMYQILNGLNYLHSCNIIHRDLKPSNITLSDRELRIIDLGLARQENSEMTGYVATRWYRAPEIMFNWQHYNRQIDCWSAGCVLAEMFTKRSIFKSNNPTEHLTLIIKTVGYPTQSQLSLWDEYAKNFIKSFLNIPVTHSFFENFPEIDSSSETGIIVLDLLQNMLKLDPNERYSILQALKHPYLSKYYSDDEDVRGEEFKDGNENFDHSVNEWKALIYNEIVNINKSKNSHSEYIIDDQMLPC